MFDTLSNVIWPTNERSGYVHVRAVAESLEVVFVGDFDVPHPVEQIASLGVTDCVLNKLASHRHVRRTFGHVELVRNLRFQLTSHFLFVPFVFEPIREEMTAIKKHANLP